MKLIDVVNIISGVPQFRVENSREDDVSTYSIYSQVELSNDLFDCEMKEETPKQIQTDNVVSTVKKGDIIFSLISGKATIIRDNHEGYYYSHNYIKLEPSNKIDSLYLVYILNEDSNIAQQLNVNLQGSSVMKYTIKQLRELELSNIPDLSKQRCIGEAYLESMKLYALRQKVAEKEKKLCLLSLATLNS